METFLTAKEGEGCSISTIRKLRRQLRTLEHFLSGRSKIFHTRSGSRPDRISSELDLAVRSHQAEDAAELPRLPSVVLPGEPGRSAQCAQDDPAFESRYCSARAQPFSEDELDRLLAQVPKTFPDSVKAARVTALIHLMVSTGLAIMDTIQLERESIAGGWLRIRRQKTNRPVEQKLDEGLYRELLSVADGNPNYIFWNGTSRPTSATGRWQEDLRQLMEDAGLWIRGNLSHRFRDTAVDFWIGAGCSVVEVAAMLGDTVPIVEKHYRKLLSSRMKERLAKVPVRVW